MNTRTRLHAHLALYAVLIAAMLCAVTATAQFGGVGVTVYTSTNFRGQSASFRSDTPSLVPYDLNDKIMSIQIPAGEAWEVCQDVDYGAQCQVLTNSVADLRSSGWSNRISSLRRVANGGVRNRRYGGGVVGSENAGIGVTVFTNPNFRGQSATFQQDTPNLVPYGLNDRVASIQIPNGEAWEICRDVDYGNQCQVLTGSVSDLRTMGWGNQVSSLRRVRNSGYRNRRSDTQAPYYGQQQGQQQGLVFFDRTGFRGSSRVVTGGASNVGISARSVQLRGGGPWELCDDSGRCATVNGDVSDISQLGLNGRITTVRASNGNYRRFGRDR